MKSQTWPPKACEAVHAEGKNLLYWYSFTAILILSSQIRTKDFSPGKSFSRNKPYKVNSMRILTLRSSWHLTNIQLKGTAHFWGNILGLIKVVYRINFPGTRESERRYRAKNFLEFCPWSPSLGLVSPLIGKSLNKQGKKVCTYNCFPMLAML